MTATRGKLEIRVDGKWVEARGFDREDPKMGETDPKSAHLRTIDNRWKYNMLRNRWEKK